MENLDVLYTSGYTGYNYVMFCRQNKRSAKPFNHRKGRNTLFSSSSFSTIWYVLSPTHKQIVGGFKQVPSLQQHVTGHIHGIRPDGLRDVIGWWAVERQLLLTLCMCSQPIEIDILQLFDLFTAFNLKICWSHQEYLREDTEENCICNFKNKTMSWKNNINHFSL